MSIGTRMGTSTRTAAIQGPVNCDARRFELSSSQSVLAKFNQSDWEAPDDFQAGYRNLTVDL